MFMESNARLKRRGSQKRKRLQPRQIKAHGKDYAMTNSNIDDKPFTVQVGKRYVRSDGGGAIEQHYRKYVEDNPEPQDKYGPWIGWNGGECPVDDDDDIVEIVSMESTSRQHRPAGILPWNSKINSIIAYRIKKEPEVKEYKVRYSPRRDGFFFEHAVGGYTAEKNAIITLTNGVPSIRWADE